MTNAKLFGPSSLNSTPFITLLTAAAAKHLYVSLPGYPPKDLSAAGKAFVSAFKTAYHHTPNVEAIFGYAAMSALLRVLASEGQKANTRPDVVKAFMRMHVTDSVLGSYSIDGAGNPSLDAFVFARLRGNTLVPFTAAPRS
jgi:ABC-type branched-subunit amino acid transport system substrate-binding protein